MTALSPAYSLTLGAQQWTEQVLSIAVTLELAPRVDTLEVRLPIAATMSANRGDRAELTIDSGEKKEVVFTGEIDAIRRDFNTLTVCCVNAGGVLARLRPAVTYEHATAATVINGLLDAMGVSAGSIDDGANLAFYVADPTRTAWEHVARVAAWGGAVARVSADNHVDVSVIDATQADVALKYGRDILAWRSANRVAAADAFVVAGEAGVGDAAAADVLRPTTDFFAGKRPDGPARGKRWRFEPALRTASAAATAGAAIQRQYVSELASGAFDALLQPQLRAGNVLDVQQLPSGLASGPVWLTRVQHELGPHRTRSQVHFQQGGDSFNPSALLGSLVGAVSGLL